MKNVTTAWDVIHDYRQRWRNALLRNKALRYKRAELGDEIQRLQRMLSDANRREHELRTELDKRGEG